MLAHTDYLGQSFIKRGLDVAYVTGEPGGEDMKRGVQMGNITYGTPELLLDNRRWRSVLTSYCNRLREFMIDEAHCVAKW